MEKVKGEHFVPQCYLNMFTNNEKLNVYDKTKGEVRPNQSVSKIAKQKAFYDFSQEELQMIKKMYPKINDEQYIEHYFSDNIEPGLKNCLETLRVESFPQEEDIIIQLDDDFKLHLSVQMAYQFLRTQGLRNNLPKLPDTDTAFLQKLMLIDDGIIAQWAKYFYDFRWMVGVNKTKTPLYTSDNPVCIYNIVTDKVGLEAWSDKGKRIIYYPYSESICVTLMDIPGNFMPTSLAVPIGDYQVSFQNALIYKNAVNYVFSKSDMNNIRNLIDFSDSFKDMKVSDEDTDSLDQIEHELINAIRSGKIDPLKLENIGDGLLTIINHTKY